MNFSNSFFNPLSMTAENAKVTSNCDCSVSFTEGAASHKFKYCIISSCGSAVMDKEHTQMRTDDVLNALLRSAGLGPVV